MRLVPAETAEPTTAVPVRIPTMDVVADEPKILDFDIENRPLAYMGMDYTSGEITSIAWSWVGRDYVEVRLLGVHSPEQILEDFRVAFNEADIVTGHYIRNHDLPIINAAMMELHLPPLTAKNSSDTKNDLLKRKYLSMSQENLAMMYELEEAKHHMAQPEWRAANRLTPEGLEKTRKRVVDDVLQHKALRERLLEAGFLKGPKMWRP